MCRWMAWLGQPVPIEELLFNTPHGIVDQALHARMGAEPTNGDGFGLGWYGHGEVPAVYRSVAPAWSDANLREIAAHVDSPLFITHVRAAIGSPVQQTNCHPFRHGRWLFVHNGYLAELAQVRRDLMLAIDPELFADVQGSTDTEVVFHLALTLGLEEDPIGALERTVGLIEAVATRHGVEGAVQGSFGVSDGERLWAVRYATEGRGAVAVRLRGHRVRAPAVPREPARRQAHERRPGDRLGAVRRPARRLARDPAVVGGDGGPGRRAGAPAVHPAAAGRGHLGPGRRGDRMTVQPRRTT